MRISFPTPAAAAGLLSGYLMIGLPVPRGHIAHSSQALPLLGIHVDGEREAPQEYKTEFIAPAADLFRAVAVHRDGLVRLRMLGPHHQSVIFLLGPVEGHEGEHSSRLEQGRGLGDN